MVGGQPEEVLKEFGASTPLGRPGQPAEMAPVYVFLASQESSYISGETLNATVELQLHRMFSEYEYCKYQRIL